LETGTGLNFGTFGTVAVGLVVIAAAVAAGVVETTAGAEADDVKVAEATDAVACATAGTTAPIWVVWLKFFASSVKSVPLTAPS
jgi:hypothetical protein